MNRRERRFLQSDVSVGEQGATPKISGYAAVFNKRSQDLGNFVEVIDPKAFDECLAGSPDIVGLINHSNDMVLGRTSSGTMKVTVDSVGLKYEIDAPDTSYAKDLVVSMKRGDIRASSFGFYALQDKWTVDSKTGDNVRTILKADCFDCSVVTNPAYLDTTSQVRSLFPDDKGVIPAEITSKIAELRESKRREKRGRNILAAVAGSKWAILPEKLETICAFLTGWSEGHKSTKEEIQAAMMGFDQEAVGSDFGTSEAEEKSPVAVLTMYGTIGQKMTMMTEFSGGFSCEGFTKQFRAALADDSISAIVFDIDSPGGTVTGVPELAAEIRAARGQKPIVAVANGMAASAAYWLASAADRLVVIPSGEVGSIGVYQMHQDVSGALDKAGVKIQFIKAGEFKTEGNPYEPASEAFLASQQKDVDAIYADFKADVAAGRGVSVAKVEADYGNGRMLMAKNALAAGMVDEIATLDQVVAGLVGASVSINTAVPATDPNESEFEVKPAAANPLGCNCACTACVNGNCAECMDEDCDDPNCDEDGEEYMNRAQPGDRTVEEIGASYLAKVAAAEGSGKTKRVDGEDLEKSAFAYQGSDELADWKLPIEFSTDAKSKSHVQNAIARWSDTDMPNADEKSKARERIRAAAKKHDITLAEGDLAMLSPEEMEANANSMRRLKLLQLQSEM